MAPDVAPSKHHSSAVEVVGRGRFAHIDALRAFAVMLVVVAHTNIGFIPGGSGVTIFFTISGFVITSLLLEERRKHGGFNISRFYVRRFLKIAPPFTAVVLAPTLVYSLWRPVSWDAVSLQVFFLFNWVEQLADPPINILPGSSVVWSLAIEEQFYLLFAAAWLLLCWRSSKPDVALLWGSLLVALSSAGLRIAFAVAGVSSERISSGTDTRIEGIALGVFLAVVMKRLESREPTGSAERPKLRDTDWTLGVALCLYVTSLVVRDPFFRDTVRYSAQSIAAGLVILYGFGSSGSRVRALFVAMSENRVVQLVGLASYSIYLAHDPIMRALMSPDLSVHPLIDAPMLVVVGTSAGLLTWRAVEVPVVKWRQGRR